MLFQHHRQVDVRQDILIRAQVGDTHVRVAVDIGARTGAHTHARIDRRRGRREMIAVGGKSRFDIYPPGPAPKVTV